VISVHADSSTVLVPVAAFTPSPGANGSIWTTELVARNVGNSTVYFGYPEGCGSLLCPEPWEFIVPNATKRIAANSAAGQMLLMISGTPVNVVFNLRVRDLSRQSETWGTEIPVVSANQGAITTVQLLNIPASGEFRTTIRIYDWSSLAE